jgi:hypothetical protein
MAAKIMWVSQHAPTPRQITTLEALFPSHHLIIDPRPFGGADDIIARYHEAQADEMVVVAPLTVIRELIKRGIKPLYAEMRQVPCNSKHAEVRLPNGRRCWRFIRFQRITAVNVKLEPISIEGEHK